MANTDVYVNKVTVPKGDGNTYTGILVDTASQKTWYGTSNTGATTQAKVVTCSGFYLQTGAIISVAFSTANTYTSAKITLNVNSTGAKDVYYNNAVTSSSNTLKWDANEQVTFIYNGTGYYFVTKSKGGAVSDVQIGGTSILSSGVANIVTNSTYNSSTNKIATMSDVTPKLNWYGTSTSGATTQEKSVTCSNYVLNTHNIVVVNFSYANTYTSAKIMLNVNSTGAKDIYYKGAVTSSTNTLLWDAGDQLTFIYDGSYYRFVSKDTNLSALTIRTWS